MNKINLFLCMFLLAFSVFSADVRRDNSNNVTAKYNQLLQFFIDNNFPRTGTEKCAELVGIMKRMLAFDSIHTTGTIKMIEEGQAKLVELLDNDTTSKVVYHLALTAIGADVTPGNLFQFDRKNDYANASLIMEYTTLNGIHIPLTTYSVWASMLKYFDDGKGKPEVKAKLLLALDKALEDAKGQLDRYTGPQY